MERDGSFFSYRNENRNFNSHAHVERDGNSKAIRREEEISTHTLTWSVTFTSLSDGVDDLISTHTLTWSVTSGASGLRSKLSISTHTLTWSVTLRPAD